jgi:hypothetical protein
MTDPTETTTGGSPGPESSGSAGASGAPPREAGPVRAYGWTWGPDEERRPRLPWIGIFLVVLGALLITERALPAYRSAGDLVVLAAGLTFLLVWILRRGTFALYAGAFLTAAAVPGVIAGFGYDAGPGMSTLAYGVAFLFISFVRAARGGGVGWQALFGIVLVAVGGSELAVPDLGALVVPGLLVLAGLYLLLRGGRR